MSSRWAKNRRLAKEQSDTRFVLMPGSRLLALWRLWTVWMVLWAVTMGPFELAFSWWITPLWFDVVMKIIDVFFWLDMLTNFFIAKVDHGRVVTDFRIRVQSYVTSWFPLDLLTNIPWDVVLSQSKAGKSRKVVKMLKLPKVLRVFRLLRVAKEEAYYFGVMVSVVVNLLLAHYGSCMWAYLLITCADEAESQDASADFAAGTQAAPCPPVLDAYTEGLSVGIAALTGADSWLRFAGREAEAAESPFKWSTSPVPEFVAAMLCLMGFCALGALFGNISHGIERRYSHTRIFHERLANLRSAERQNDMNPSLYRRVRKHYHYVWSCGSNAAVSVLNDTALSADLRCQLSVCFYGSSLRQVPFLLDAKEDLVKNLCARVRVECFAPEDYLITAGEFGSELYFLVVGQVRIEIPAPARPSSHASADKLSQQQPPTIIRTLVEGSFFGEMGLFLPDARRTASVVADTAGWVLEINRTDLEAICSDELLDSLRSVAVERQGRLTDSTRSCYMDESNASLENDEDDDRDAATSSAPEEETSPNRGTLDGSPENTTPTEVCKTLSKKSLGAGMADSKIVGFGMNAPLLGSSMRRPSQCGEDRERSMSRQAVSALETYWPAIDCRIHALEDKITSITRTMAAAAAAAAAAAENRAVASSKSPTDMGDACTRDPSTDPGPTASWTLGGALAAPSTAPSIAPSPRQSFLRSAVTVNAAARLSRTMMPNQAAAHPLPPR